MKTKKIYWRLAFLLSLIPAIAWAVVWCVNKELPTWTDDLWIDWQDIIPLWAISKWWDILGVFLLVLVIHNVSLRRIWNKDPSGMLQYTLYGVVILLIIVGLFLSILAIIEMNILVAASIFAIDITITTIILYAAQQIPVDWQERAKNWIMQKDKEEKL